MPEDNNQRQQNASRLLRLTVLQQIVMIPTQHASPAAAHQRLADFLNSCNREELHQAFVQPWLNAILPGIRDLVGCDQGSRMHLEGDVAVHTSFVFENMRTTAQSRLGRNPDFIEQLSAVVHDLRKPATRTPQPDGGVSFPGHEAKAAEEVPKIARALGLSTEESARLLFLVARHGDAHGFPGLPVEQRHKLTTSPWRTSLALLQEADARSCVLLDGSHLPIYWSELRGENAAEQ